MLEPSFVLGYGCLAYPKKPPANPSCYNALILFLVVCAFWETIATFSPTSAFISVLFPTFGLPRMAMKPELNPFFCINPYFQNPPHSWLFPPARASGFILFIHMVISKQLRG
jgi:hypothetical protein